ncbi:hypothetical protein RB195_006293 [Necator americanus]|uniref:Uncharacterized protein n=1 Tax=Necator americanus TaxID=51031 RepID=A0ABR1BRX7_NECAM
MNLNYSTFLSHLWSNREGSEHILVLGVCSFFLSFIYSFCMSSDFYDLLNYSNFCITNCLEPTKKERQP